MYFLIAVFSGVLASLGFAPYGVWLAPVISLFILFIILKGSELPSRLLISYLFGLSILLPNQFWTGTYVGDLPWIVLALLQSFLFLPLAVVSQKGGRFNPWLFSCAVVVTELALRTIPFTGFGWSRLSFTQVDGFFSSLYPLIGSVGVIFLISYLVSNRNILIFSTILLAIAALNFIDISEQKSGEMRIALVQGGVTNLGLEFNSTPREVFQRHLLQTKSKISPNQVDLIIWPENSVDVDLFSNIDIQNALIETSKVLNTPILVGGITRVSGDLQNISVLFDPEVQDIYVKRYLTPFGEYIPLRSFLEKFSTLTNDVDDFSAGNRSNFMQIADFDAQVFICYELLNDVFKNQINSDFLIVQTNNATFGDTPQLDQELQIARVRALESGREVAYVSTTGVTAFIDRSGKVKSELPKFKSDVLIDTVSTYSDRQINQKMGFTPEIFSIFMIILLLNRIRRAQ
jgi:apolipoprotein N-acyltransferase